MIEQIKKSLSVHSGDWKEKKGLWEFSSVIAERRAFLSKKKITYSAKIRIDEIEKVVAFSEMLIENGSGFSVGGGFGGGFDDGISTGFGFKTESFNTLNGGARQGSIEEKFNLFGKTFQYNFDYKEIRSKVEESAKSAGYTFTYQIFPVR